ncbi:hypothetical protein N1851_006099 [Merluccius polli]|uniref:Uncharacterized protein n=1 Tax=Merluccius polli TaxID=89951 RepID=A0AA47N639_MERPO|nr:hypothetical protein N1851_006099 [Merluccius polli]
MVIWSEVAKKVILIELTVPWEDGCSDAHERKATKYQDLVQQCRDKGWQAWLFPVEVGCMGFPAQSVWNTLTALGIRGRERKTAARRSMSTRGILALWTTLLHHKDEDAGKDAEDAEDAEAAKDTALRRGESCGLSALDTGVQVWPGPSQPAGQDVSGCSSSPSTALMDDVGIRPIG